MKIREAPTSRMISISLRRARAVSRIVLATSRIEARISAAAAPHELYWSTSMRVKIGLTSSLAKVM